MRLLLGMMIVVEILGFSFASMLPAVAERILEVGPERLGVLTAGVAVGAMFGTALLVFTTDRLPHGLMLVTVFVTFGLLVVVLGHSTAFWLSVAATAGIGASAAMVDALQWIMLQLNVRPEVRGRALGGVELRDRLGLDWSAHARRDGGHDQRAGGADAEREHCS